MKRKLVVLALLILSAFSLWGGDTAVFVDLGFSADGRTYMFGQYGIQPDSLKPWADLCVVDVGSNNFVPGGRINYVHDSAVAAGHDGSGALYRIIARNTALADRYNIGYLRQGHLLYVSMENGVPVSEGGLIEFRDFEKASSFQAIITVSGGPSGSSFTINLERRNNDGSARSYQAGNGQIKRPGIASYRIRRVLAAPQNNALVFVIEMKKRNGDGSTDIRYMVETLKL